MQAAESEGEDLDLLGGHDIDDVGIIDILARELYESTVCTVTSAREFIFNNAICIAAHKIKSELSEAAYKFMKHAYKFIFKMKDLLLPLIVFVVICVVTFISIAIDKSISIDMSRILMLESELSELRLLINTRVLDETEESSMTERDQGDNFWMTICSISLSLLAVRRV